MVAMTARRPNRTAERQSGVFNACPECGGRTKPTTDGWSTYMYCEACDAQWRFTMGWVSRVRVPPTPE